MKLVLASGSPYRKQQLESIGLLFEAHSPMVNEEELKDPALSPTQLAAYLAEQKALSLQSKFPESWILGADQLVHFKGEVLGKAGNFDGARTQLLKLQGEVHELITSFCLVGPTASYTYTDETQLQMRSLSAEDIEAYLKKDEPFDCAGSYKLEKAGITLFENIISEDFTAIQGLPLIAFTQCWLEATGELPFAKT